VETLFNAFRLVLFFSFVPVALGLVTASVVHRVATGRLGTVSRTVLFLPQVIPLVAAGIIWGRLLSLSGLVNQGLEAIGLGDTTRAWLGDFDTALPAVGFIGIWVLLGFCTVLLLTGMTKIDVALYESARMDGAGWWSEFRAITLPSLRYEIGVCLTVTIIAALAAFDIVYVATGGGPGNATSVPGIQIYILAFLERQVGLASALAVVLMFLVLLVILPIQRLTREQPR
jgi:raffinose/stachyose/melibiose transport system permease protein